MSAVNTGASIRVQLDGYETFEAERGITPLEVAQRALEAASGGQGPGGKEASGTGIADGGGAVAAEVNGQLVDLTRPITSDAVIRLIGFDDPRGAQVFRHSTAHLMAQAICELFPDAQLAIGPALEDRFYYDIDVSEPLTPEVLETVEGKMHELVDRGLPIEREEIPREEGIRLFASRGQNYKAEILEEVPDGGAISIYRQGDFVDLCRGPHVPNTRWIGHAFKLLAVSGAYWRGDETRQSLQRIYGTGFPDYQALEQFLARLEEARLRDHRVLGRELGLIEFFEEAGPGLVFYPPRGAILKRILEQWLTDEHLARGYQLVSTPHLIKADMWRRSGHYDTGYPMFLTELDGQEYGVKPMNCPGHILLYQSSTRSYRDLPIRYFELGTVYRGERPGVLHGLLRVRGFTQDDAHIFCTEDQLTGEISGVLDFAREMLYRFEFEESRLYLATRPEKSVGRDEMWERATESLVGALRTLGLEYEVDPGGGAFYGPKIDVKLRDALGRLWQGPTIQCDFNLPERFDLTYVGEDGQEHRPVMIHRVVLAGIERFIGILIEHYAGAFPLWLAPLQVIVLPIADRHVPYAAQVASELTRRGFRCSVDERNERISYKVRDAELQKIPYMLVVGDREEQENRVAVRKRNEGDRGSVALDELLTELSQELEGSSRK